LKWKESRNESSTRYALLRNVWMNSEWPCRNQILPLSCITVIRCGCKKEYLQ
jgi:hypothetical protein